MRIDPDTCRDPDLLAAEVRRLQAVIDAGEPTADEVSKWISVEDSMPYAGRGDLLLYQDHRDGCGSQAVGYFHAGEFWLYEDDNVTADAAGVTITHWQPLPPDPD